MKSAGTWPQGPGRMAAAIRDTDWSLTDFGPREAWPPPLCRDLETMLGIGFPAFLWWGTHHLLFRNDPAAALVRFSGARGPSPRAGGVQGCLRRPSCGGGRPHPGHRRAAVAHPGHMLSDPRRVRRRGRECRPGPTPDRGASRDPRAVGATGRGAAQQPQHVAVIRSIARRSTRNRRSVADYADHLDGRITALSRVQTALSSDARGVKLAALAADTRIATGARPRDGGRIVVDWGLDWGLDWLDPAAPVPDFTWV